MFSCGSCFKQWMICILLELKGSNVFSQDSGSASEPFSELIQQDVAIALQSGTTFISCVNPSRCCRSLSSHTCHPTLVNPILLKLMHFIAPPIQPPASVGWCTTTSGFADPPAHQQLHAIIELLNHLFVSTLCFAQDKTLGVPFNPHS